MLELSQNEYSAIRTVIRSELGIELGPDRIAMVRRRLSGMADGETLIRKVASRSVDKQALDRLANALTTNHTHFGREFRHFDCLAGWLDDHPQGHVRIWSAASSSGEEAYTMWMVAQEHALRTRRVSILGTDISETVLAAARQGVYPESQVQRLEEAWQRRYFERQRDGTCQVSPQARQSVLFRRFNLLTPVLPFQNQFQVIFCRNVLIYFDDETRRAVVRRVLSQLEVGGLFCIGLAETLPRGIEGLERIEPSAFRKVS